MMDIYLIRHGECDISSSAHYDPELNIVNPPLTEIGTQQAAHLADRCRAIGFDLIVSSDLTRAMQTAEQILAQSPCEYTVNPSFREIDMGDIPFKSWHDFPELYAKWSLHDEDIPYPNGENGQDVWQRCKAPLDVLLATNHQKIAIVCHGGTIRSIICGVLNLPQQKRFYLGAPLENASISILKYIDGRVSLHTFNDIAHL